MDEVDEVYLLLALILRRLEEEFAKLLVLLVLA